MDNATKRPWTHSPSKPFNILSSGNIIAKMKNINEEANARLIVKAVNCHDDLVEALKSIISIQSPKRMMDGKSKMGDENRVMWNYALIAKQALYIAGESPEDSIEQARRQVG